MRPGGNFARLVRGALALILATAVLGILSFGTIEAASCTITWNNPSGGLWATAANWTPNRTPISTDDVCINVNGTYTVVYNALDSNYPTVTSLTVGGGTGVQTLQIASTASAEALMEPETVTITSSGILELTDGPGAINLAAITGTITNAGEIVLDQGNGGTRHLAAAVTNTGTIQDNSANGFFDALSSTTTNEGTVAVANGDTLTVEYQSFANLSGTIGAAGPTGTGQILVLCCGTYTQGSGTTAGVFPVTVDDDNVAFTGSGASTIAVEGTSTLTGAPVSGQTLDIQSTCLEPAVLTSATGITNTGTINLTNGDGCGNNATLTLTSGSLKNSGTIHALVPVGGSRTINANVTSNKAVTVDAGATLQVNGTFTQTSKGSYNPGINSSSSIGQINASGAASIAGVIRPTRLGTYVPTAGTVFDVLNGSSLTGTFTTEKKGNINTKGLYFLPTYLTASAELTVTQATAHMPTSAAPGAVIAISGGTWAPNDQISISFTDSAKVKTVYPTFSADSTGAFSTNETIPATAAAGKGTVAITSLTTGAIFSASITIT